MPETAPATGEAPNIATFNSVVEVDQAMAEKRAYSPHTFRFYPRDGSPEQATAEARLAELSGFDPSETLAYTSGMAATTEAIDEALHQTPNEHPVLALADQTYSQTRCYIDEYLRGRGVEVHLFDSGSFDDGIQNLQSVIERREPDVIVAETIGNFANMPVLDTSRLLSLVRDLKRPPTLVLDNTLPLSTGLPLGEQINDGERIIVVESATKNGTFNEELLGVAYTKHPELLKGLLRQRRARGTPITGASLDRVLELLPESRSGFDERNRALFRNTGAIALLLYQALRRFQESSGHAPAVTISHPALPTHDNHELYMTGYPDGGAPVAFIQSLAIDRRDLLAGLWDSPAVQEYVKISQSFGFNTTRMIYDERGNLVRISGGAEANPDIVGAALAESFTENVLPTISA